jgi:predicted nucleotidyltransferase/DNA-binding XRE family transcriptional regulator
MARAGDLIRQARTEAGLSQVKVADRAGVTQSVLSLYERGRREPSLPTLERLVEACGRRLRIQVELGEQPSTGGPLSRRVAARREDILRILDRAGVTDPHVFGSVARREDTKDSDLDLLVRLPEAGMGLFGILSLQGELGELLGVPVDVVPDDSLKDSARADILGEAVPL